MARNSELEALRARRRVLLEKRVVRMILSTAGLQHCPSARSRNAGIDTGGSQARLKDFYHQYPDFPLEIRVPQGQVSFDFGWTDLWSAFKRNPLYAEYASQFFSESIFKKGGYCGLAFSGSHIGLMIVHNYPCSHLTLDDTRIERFYGRRRLKLVVEPLRLALAAIPNEWHES